jgi:hypothetical protein
VLIITVLLSLGDGIEALTDVARSNTRPRWQIEPDDQTNAEDLERYPRPATRFRTGTQAGG